MYLDQPRRATLEHGTRCRAKSVGRGFFKFGESFRHAHYLRCGRIAKSLNDMKARPVFLPVLPPVILCNATASPLHRMTVEAKNAFTILTISCAQAKRRLGLSNARASRRSLYFKCPTRLDCSFVHVKDSKASRILVLDEHALMVKPWQIIR
jgi:hypothetical protein